MEVFTIITGSGRCGTSALTKFFVESQRVNMIYGDYLPDFRAGYENGDSIQANAFLTPSAASAFSYLEHNNINEGINLIKEVTKHNNLVKTPSFFFYNTYNFWKKHNTKDELLVLLLKRDKPENVLKSASSINQSKEWDFFSSPEEIKNHYLKNIKNLKDNNIKYIELEFPRFTTDPEYLYSKLSTSHFNFTREVILELSNKVFQDSQITIK